MLQGKHARLAQVIGMQKLSLKGVPVPQQVTVAAPLFFCLMEAANKGWHYMAAAWVIVVARPIEIGGHQADRIKAVLKRSAWQSLIPAILAMAYQALVGSSAPVSRDSSRIGCSANFG